MTHTHSDHSAKKSSTKTDRNRATGRAILRAAWLLGAILLFCTELAQAQTYPTKPIRMIVPWPPGGGVDTTTRMISPPLAERLGQPIAVENRGGAGGNIGTELAAHEKPDGYTLLMASLSPHSINPYLYSRLGFDPIKSFTPIVLLWTVPNILVVPAASPFNSAQELVAYAKANPGKLNFGSGGVGSSQHLSGIILGTAAKIDIVHVAYKGAGPAQTALVAGHLDLMLDTPPALVHVAAGRLKALAVTSKTRNPAIPNVPTFDEVGIPGVYMEVWYGIAGPAGLPREVIDRVNRETNVVLQTPEMKKRVLEYAAQIRGGTPEEFEKFMVSELKRFEAVVKASGAKVE
ncbi:MAG TPA: tripartite tricarboxylate transporter substrate binding protein [Candidatus Methylomirabilis sp.]|nr:tripartite tricarboxylate transporter substrate binding protein [Candidatus Methylomirabilis sp.]